MSSGVSDRLDAILVRKVDLRLLYFIVNCLNTIFVSILLWYCVLGDQSLKKQFLAVNQVFRVNTQHVFHIQHSITRCSYHTAADGELSRLARLGALHTITSRPSGAARRRSAAGHAASRGSLRCLQELHRSGADLVSSDPCRGFTPLHLAAVNGHTEVIRWLVSATGGFTEPRDSFYNRTPLHCAVVMGQEDSVRCLVELGADVAALDACFSTPLSLALRPTNEEGSVRELDASARKTWEGGAALLARKARIAVYLEQECKAPGVSVAQRIADLCEKADPEQLEKVLHESRCV